MIPPDDALALRGHVLATLAIDRLAGATLGRCSYKFVGWTGRIRRCTATGVRVRTTSTRVTPGGGVRCVCPRHGYQPGVTPIVTDDRAT